MFKQVVQSLDQQKYLYMCYEQKYCRLCIKKRSGGEGAKPRKFNELSLLLLLLLQFHLVFCDGPNSRLVRREHRTRLYLCTSHRSRAMVVGDVLFLAK